MTANGMLQIALYFIALIAAAVPLGRYMARVYSGEAVFLSRLAGPLERWIYRCCRIDQEQEMDLEGLRRGIAYFQSGGFSCRLSAAAAPGIPAAQSPRIRSRPPGSGLQYRRQLRDQYELAGLRRRNDDELLYADGGTGRPELRFRGVGNGSAAAFIRGLKRTLSQTIGNVWVDLTRSVLYILLPLSLVMALFLVSQGVVQTLQSPAKVQLLEPTTDEKGNAVSGQEIRLGPAASQVAIKQLGTNGGGFFNANSSHPLENPTPLSNFAEMLAILLIPAALCITFGRMMGDRRQGWALLAAMMMILIPLLGICLLSEQTGNISFRQMNVDQSAGALQSGRKHGRQGGPVRDREFRSLGRCDDGCLQRERQRHARFVHAAGRSCAPLADTAG